MGENSSNGRRKMVGVLLVSVSSQLPLHSINITNVFIVRNRQRQQWRHYAEMWQVIERIMPPPLHFASPSSRILLHAKLLPSPLFSLLYAQVALLFVFPARTLIWPDVCAYMWCLAYCRCCTPNNKKECKEIGFSAGRLNTLVYE